MERWIKNNKEREKISSEIIFTVYCLRRRLAHSLLFYAQSDEQSLPVLSISAFSQFRFLTLFVIDL